VALAGIGSAIRGSGVAAFAEPAIGEAMPSVAQTATPAIVLPPISPPALLL
jgi:hypothetical protein